MNHIFEDLLNQLKKFHFMLGKRQFNAAQREELLLGLSNNVNVDFYNNKDLTAEQMREIRLGLQSKVDVSKYADKSYSAQQMQELRIALEKELDITRQPLYI